MRPDISYVVKELSRDVKSPTLESLKAEVFDAISSWQQSWTFVAMLILIGPVVTLFWKNLILEAEFARKVRIEAYTDSTAGKSVSSRFGSGKRTKHVELRYLYMQNLVQAGWIVASQEN